MSDDHRAFITPEALAERFHDTFVRLGPEHGYTYGEPWSETPEYHRAHVLATAREVLSWLRCHAIPDDDENAHFQRGFGVGHDAGFREAVQSEHLRALMRHTREEGYAAGQKALTEETIPKLNALMERLLGRLDAMDKPDGRVARGPCSVCGCVLTWGATEPLPLVCGVCRGDS
jgi:hypothetical protein